jgi:DMSO/TMAO reductase YedYZ heme-binding membrane subunit
MANKRKPLSLWYLALVGILALVLTIAVEFLDLGGMPLNWAIRGAALLGYQSVFLAIVSSAYMRQLVRLFGRPFVQVHHVVSVSGLILITLHPLGVALDNATISVLVPRFESGLASLRLGGQLAWNLIALAALVALLRRSVGRPWRVVHRLNYVAFLSATVHANLIGTNLQYIVARALSIVMALVIVGVFVQKRLRRRRPAKRRT